MRAQSGHYHEHAKWSEYTRTSLAFAMTTNVNLILISHQLFLIRAQNTTSQLMLNMKKKKDNKLMSQKNTTRLRNISWVQTALVLQQRRHSRISLVFLLFARRRRLAGDLSIDSDSTYIIFARWRVKLETCRQQCSVCARKNQSRRRRRRRRRRGTNRRTPQYLLHYSNLWPDRYL